MLKNLNETNMKTVNSNKVCKHNPKTGGHLCNSEVPQWAKSNSSWICETNFRGKESNRTEDYLGGEWCCTNRDDEVTCFKCKKLI